MAVNKIYIPTFISNERFEPAQVQPRVFYYNGKIDAPEYKVDAWSSDTGLSRFVYSKDEIPYFDHYNVVSGSEPSTNSKSLLFFNESAVYGTIPGNTLYSEYWETYIQLLYNPVTRLINAEAVIPLAEYFELELNDIVKWRGNYYHLRAINDYSFTTGECSIQLLGPIIQDALDAITVDCYSYTIYADSLSATTFTWVDCDGNGDGTSLSAGTGASITCVRPGTLSADQRGASWEAAGVCGSYQIPK